MSSKSEEREYDGILLIEAILWVVYALKATLTKENGVPTVT